MNGLIQDRIGNLGDVIKEKTFRKSAEDRLQIAEEFITNPELWKGNPQAAEEVRSIISPKVGEKLHPNFMKSHIDLDKHDADNIQEVAQQTYSQVLEEDPNSAEEFRKTFHVDFDGRETVKNRVDSLLTDYEDLGLSEDEALKEALTVVNQTEYELDGSEFNGEYAIDLVHNRSLEQQLSDAVFSRLEGEAKAFFDYARREDSPEGMHENLSINARSADNYNPVEALEERARQLKEQFGSEADPNQVIEDRENLYKAMNVQNLIERASLGHRFDMDDKEVYEEEAQAYVDTWLDRLDSHQKDNADYADKVVKIIESAGEYHGPGSQELGKAGLNEKVDEMMDHIDYLKEQASEFRDGRQKTEERRTKEEKDSGFLNGFLN